MHTCPAHRLWEYSNSSCESYLDLMPNSHNWFTQECVAARGKNQQLNLGGLRVDKYFKWWTWKDSNQ